MHWRKRVIYAQSVRTYLYASNLGEFDPLLAEPVVTVTPVRDSAPLADYHALLLPAP